MAELINRTGSSPLVCVLTNEDSDQDDSESKPRPHPGQVEGGQEGGNSEETHPHQDNQVRPVGAGQSDPPHVVWEPAML